MKREEPRLASPARSRHRTSGRGHLCSRSQCATVLPIVLVRAIPLARLDLVRHPHPTGPAPPATASRLIQAAACFPAKLLVCSHPRTSFGETNVLAVGHGGDAFVRHQLRAASSLNESVSARSLSPYVRRSPYNTILERRPISAQMRLA